MQTPPTTEPEAAVGPTVDKSRFKFQKLLQPFTIERGIATPIIWFLLDWLVLGVSIASLLVVETWWVKVFASGGGPVDRAPVRDRSRCLPRLLHSQQDTQQVDRQNCVLAVV